MAPPLADDRLYRVGAALEAALEPAWGGPLLERISGDRSRNVDARDHGAIQRKE